MTKQAILVSVLAMGMMSGVVRAQKADVQIERERKAQTLLEIAQDQGAATMQKSTYLGIASSPVPAALREQLKLKRGVGLVVERVEKNSPADQAGVKQYDIVEKLDDQVLINADQFAGLVRMQEPGTQVKLSIIRQGQPQTITATLVEAVMPADYVLRKNVLIAEPNGALTITAPTIRDFKFSGPIEFNTRTPRNMTITSAVGKNLLTITRDGDNTHLYANDQAGTELFDGDVNTEEQWKLVPPDIAAEAGRLMATMKLKTPFPWVLTSNPHGVDVKVPLNVAPGQPVVPNSPQPALP